MVKFAASNQIVTNMIKAIALIRTSTIQQEIESQKEQVLEMCYSDGLTIDEVEIVGQQGASAIKVDEIYQKNIQMVYDLINSNPQIKCVYAWAIDRIGRKESILHNFREFLVSKGVQLKIKANNLVLLDENGKEDFGVKLQFSLYATLASAEMENKKERFKRARERNNKEGKYNGGKLPLYGYGVNDKGYFVENPEESAIVKEIYTEYASGKYSIVQLAREMNERGYIRRGKRFTGEVIKVWLNYWECYCGKSEHIKYPPIISVRLAESVRDMLRTSKKSRPRTYKHNYFASKLIKCLCGSFLTAINYSYDCTRKTKREANIMAGRELCNYKGNSIMAYILDGILWNVTKDCHRRFLEEMDSYKREELNGELIVMKKKLVEFESQQDKIKLKRKRLAQSYILDALDDDEMDELKGKLDEQEKHLLMKKNTCQERINAINRLLAVDKDKAWLAQNRFLSILELDMEQKEKEMYDLVHKYITDGELSACEDPKIEGLEGKMCVKVTVRTIYHDEFVFYHFGKVKRGHKTWYVDEDGECYPYWFDYVVRTKDTFKLVSMLED